MKEKQLDQNMELKNFNKLFINLSTKKGKKEICEKLFISLLFNLKKKKIDNPNVALFKMFTNPTVKIKITKISKNKSILQPISFTKQLKKSIKTYLINNNNKIYIKEIFKNLDNKTIKLNKIKFYKHSEQFNSNRTKAH